MNKNSIIASLFNEFAEIRYVALYSGDDLTYRQKEQTADSSSDESDKYEELLVNPTLLKLASQRGNIDCGGLNHLIIGYGNFHQIVKSIPEGHISICVEQTTDLNQFPTRVFSYLEENFPGLLTRKSTI